MTVSKVDAITIEVISQSLAGIVQEMQNSLFCTGYSTIIRESRDASCAIMDAAGRVLAQFTVLPLHLGAFPACVQGLLQFYSLDELCDGDAFVVNHPYFGGSPHAPDMAVISPIVVDGQLFGFSGSIAHKSDIGGLVPGSNSGQAREIFHEGLMVPPVRFYAARELVREVETLLRANSRTPELVVGDLRGQVGSTWLGVGRIQALCEKYSMPTVLQAAEQLYLLTEKQVRAAVAEWPDGEYAGEAVLHDEGVEGGRPVHVRVLATIRGDQVTFDFSDADDQVDGPFNIRPPLVRAVCSYALKCLIDPDLPTNHGLTLAVETTTRDGSVLSPIIPAPVNTYMPIANVTAEAVFDALGGAVPRARIAGSSGGQGGTLSHTSNRSGYPQVQYELPAGAVGARRDSDGVSASKAHVANGTITPVEIIESEFPVELVRFELIRDSGGAGRFRGGLGYVREYRMLGDSQLSARGGKLLTPPRGRDGGHPGRLPALTLNPGTSNEHLIRPQDGNVRLHAGDILRREQPGSGGYGDPCTREPEQVLEDVREGYVSPDSARELYGVAIARDSRSSNWVIDLVETARLRGQAFADR
jgi:N-methylhydantoinase B